MVEVISPKHQGTLKELDKINADVMNMRTQKHQHEQAGKNLSDMIKDYKANRSKKISMMMGNLLIEKDSKFAVKHLMDIKNQTAMGLKTTTEQLEMKEDMLESLIIKSFRALRSIVPRDIAEEPLKEKKDVKA